MNRILAVATVLVAVSGCSDLPTTGDGVVALEVTTPTPLTLVQGSTRQLTARALNAAGEPVEVAITWATPDTTVTVSESGLVTAVAASGTGRVQASVGTLRSNLIVFTLQAPPTGLRAGP
jgi:hypothetical protein